jgi:hypothetical protein
MKTIKMLPYSWKKVGWSLLALSLLLFIVCFKAIVHDLIFINQPYVADAFGQGWGSSLFVVFFVLGIVLIALSKEKAEDERIAEMRHSALIWTVLLFLAICLINLLSNLILTRVIDSDTLMKAMIIKRYFTCVPAFILYYLLIFKVSLWSDQKRLSDEE